MNNTNYLLTLLLAFFILFTSEVFAVQDSIKPMTAKGAWRFVCKEIELDHGTTPVLFKAYPEKEIDAYDTLLCYIDIDHTGQGYRGWNGNAYKWIFECKLPFLHSDTMLNVTASLKIASPVTITKEKIYKPLTKYADTLGIPENSWFDSDSIYKFRVTTYAGFFRSFFLERGVPDSYLAKQPVRTIWNMVSYNNNSGERVQWLGLDAKTGERLTGGIVSVSEQDDAETNAVSITPNPSSTSISIQTDKEVGWVNLYSMMGEKIYEWSAVLPHQKLSVAHLTEGMYMVQYQDNGTIRSIPIVISR